MDLASILASLLEGRTSIVVTHDRDEAAVLADRIAVLTEGRIRQVGTPGDVLSLPVNEAVAEVVGVSNVLRGTVRDADEGLVALDVGGISIWGLGDTASGNAVALFGAETVTVYPGEVRDAGSARNRWPGTVLEVRPAGRLVEIVVDCGAPIAALLTPGSLEALEIAEGALVTLAVKATAVRVAAR